MCERCENNARPTCEPRKDIASAKRRHCDDNAKTLRRQCADSAQRMRRHIGVSVYKLDKIHYQIKNQEF